MTIIYCQNEDCKYCDPDLFICTRNIVSVGEFFECGCEEYESYLDSEEYREKYFIAVKVGEVLAKAVKYGKKIELKGRVFYTQDRAKEFGENRITDKRTGYSVGTVKRLDDLWDKYLETEKTLPDVESYPLAIYDTRTHNYKLVEKGGE